MTVKDCQMLLWFLRQPEPVTTPMLAKRWGLHVRTARRRFVVWEQAGVAMAVQFTNPIQWRPKT